MKDAMPAVLFGLIVAAGISLLVLTELSEVCPGVTTNARRAMVDERQEALFNGCVEAGVRTVKDCADRSWIQANSDIDATCRERGK